MTIYVNINRAKLAANKKLPFSKRQGAVSVRYGKSGTALYGSNVVFSGIATLVQNERKPLPCGARVWIETEYDVKIDGLLITEHDLRALNRRANEHR